MKNNIFLKLLSFLILLITACKHDMQQISIPPTDVEFIDDFYNQTIDASKINMYEATRLNDSGVLAYALGNNIVMRESFDYLANPLRFRHIFVHELMHVWQYQHFKFNVGAGDDYEYYLFEHESFFDYGREEQADIMESFFRVSFINGVPKHTCLDCDKYDSDTILERYTDLYMEVITYNNL